MKLLKQMLVINWHYFSHVLVPFDQINFLTGQNAAGKSTLLDALQVVMLGETKTYIFNKAANDKSERTIVGYLKGELGDDGDTGFRYLREGDFNACIVLEFYDTVKQASLIAGVHFDVYGDGTQKHSFFIADCPIPDHQFLTRGIPYNRDQVRSFLKDTTKSRHQWFDTQGLYRNHLMSKLGNIKLKFFSLFKKAVPFAPITDIEQFITEYITDIKGRPNIEDMQHNLRHYKRLEQEAKQLEDRILRLRAMGDVYGQVQAKSAQQALHEVLSQLAEEAMAIEGLSHLALRLTELEGELTATKAKQVSLSQEVNQLEVQLEGLIEERFNSDLHKKLQAIEGTLSQLALEYQQLKKDYLETQAILETKTGQLLRLQATDLLAFDDHQPLDFDWNGEGAGEALLRLNALLKRGEAKIAELRFQLELQIKALTESIADWTQTLSNLKRGIKDYPKDVLRLKAHLTGLGIGEVAILADELEVTDPQWQHAVEGYLHTQKFYVLCREGDYPRALKAYHDLQSTAPIYQVGLIDTGKLREASPKVAPGSLAEVIATDSEGARLFVAYTLGRVIRASSLETLRDHPTSITAQCMLYQNFVARRLSPDRWQTPFIGRQAIEKQIVLIEGQLADASERMAALQRQHQGIKAIALQSFSEVELGFHQGRLAGRARMAACQGEMDRLTLEREGLDLSYLDKLTQKIEGLKKDLEGLRQDQTQVAKALGRMESDSERLVMVELPEAQGACERWEKALAIRDEALLLEARTRFKALCTQQAPKDIAVNYARSAKAAASEGEGFIKKLTSLREDYNRVYHMAYDIQATTNSVYAQVLSDLETTKLPDYMGKIKEAQDRATIQFRDEFLSKLKENFDAVTLQIKELNAAIKDSPFGTDNYRFEVKPKAEMRHFYNMIMDDLLMGEGMSIMSHAFNAKHQEAIDELFRSIVDTEGEVDSTRRSILENQINYFTNYRSYLQFDLVVKDQMGNEQRLSKTLLKKSGGETQTPFYLAVLASFAHMYRVNQKGSGSETMRLIVFDEAFSKMDQQRIEESLKLLRRFKLQAIISAPPDKIMDIAPHVDQNLCVFRQKDISFVQAFSKQQIEEMAE